MKPALLKVSPPCEHFSTTGQWANLLGYPDYDIYKNGLIISHAGRNRPAHWLHGCVVQFKDKRRAHLKYRQHDLYDEQGKRCTMQTADIIWAAFMGPIPPGKKVYHKDNDRLNDALDNLALMDWHNDGIY